MKTETLRLNVFEIKCLRPMVVVKRLDRVMNDGIRRKAAIEETLAEKVDRTVIRWFGHLERISNGR